VLYSPPNRDKRPGSSDIVAAASLPAPVRYAAGNAGVALMIPRPQAPCEPTRWSPGGLANEPQMLAPRTPIGNAPGVSVLKRRYVPDAAGTLLVGLCSRAGPRNRPLANGREAHRHITWNIDLAGVVVRLAKPGRANPTKRADTPLPTVSE